MNSAKSISVLNQLVRLHNRSLASYLCYASPTWHRGDDKARATLQLLSKQQQEVVDRGGNMIIDRGAAVDYGAYPMYYTGFHDLSFSFLLDRLLEEQQQLVGEVEECVARAQGDDRLRELAQEALGMAKGQNELLAELKNASTEA